MRGTGKAPSYAAVQHRAGDPMAFRFVPGRTTRRAASGAVRILRATAKANAAAARRTGALM